MARRAASTSTTVSSSTLFAVTRSLPLLHAVFRQAEDGEHLRQHPARPLLDLVRIQVADGVRHRRVAVAGKALPFRHGVAGAYEGCRDDNRRRLAPLLEDRPVR